MPDNSHGGPTPLHDCHFHVDNTDRGYIGRVHEHDDLHTRPHDRRLDALDDIITLTREKLRRLHADMTDIRKAARQR